VAYNRAIYRDGWQFFKVMDVTRTWNAIQIFSSYYISRLLKKPIHWGMPISISIEPTTSCNLRCPECPSGLRSFSRPIGMLTLDLAEKVLGQISKYTPYLILYFQGEPYLNQSFLPLVKLASGKKMYTATSTNAHYLTDAKAKETVESGLSRLIISIDGTTQEVYEQYRIGGKIDKVIEGTKNIIAWKKKLKSATPHIIFQFLVVKPNEHQMDDVVKLAKELGVDEVKFKSAQVYEYEHGNELIPTVEKYSRYKKLPNGTYRLKHTLLNHCWKMWHSCVVTWDGKIVPCCFDKDATHRLGDLQNNDSFRSIWKGTAYQKFRGQLINSRKEIDICTNCTEGAQVWI